MHRRAARNLQLPKPLIIFLAATTVVLAFLPINNYFRGSLKDYAKYFAAGQTVLEGGDLYEQRGDGTFHFMYPPPAAVVFAVPSYLGQLPLINKRIRRWIWFWLSVLPLSFTIPIEAFRPLRAAGSTLLACLLLIAGLGWHLRSEARNTHHGV